MEAIEETLFQETHLVCVVYCIANLRMKKMLLLFRKEAFDDAYAPNSKRKECEVAGAIGGASI